MLTDPRLFVSFTANSEATEGLSFRLSVGGLVLDIVMTPVSGLVFLPVYPVNNNQDGADGAVNNNQDEAGSADGAAPSRSRG